MRRFRLILKILFSVITLAGYLVLSIYLMENVFGIKYSTDMLNGDLGKAVKGFPFVEYLVHSIVIEQGQLTRITPGDFMGTAIKDFLRLVYITVASFPITLLLGKSVGWICRFFDKSDTIATVQINGGLSHFINKLILAIVDLVALIITMFIVDAYQTQFTSEVFRILTSKLFSENLFRWIFALVINGGALIGPIAIIVPIFILSKKLFLPFAVKEILTNFVKSILLIALLTIIYGHKTYGGLFQINTVVWIILLMLLHMGIDVLSRNIFVIWYAKNILMTKR